MSVPSDIEISQAAKITPIQDFARSIGLEEDDLDIYGKYKAKVHLDVLDKLSDRKNGYYIDVTCITPTPLGEGKTVTSIGLTQGLGHIGKKSMVCIRQPSLGPTFGIKGGAAGGGYSQVVPMEEFNLHLTGDLHAISIAHNLIAAALDSRIYHESKIPNAKLEEMGIKPLYIDPYAINWNRVVDINDRALRHITVGMGGSENGVPREAGYDITAASELMAILALSTDLKDMRERIGRCIVAFTKHHKPVTVEDLGVAGAAAVLLKDTIMPNLMQTLEGQPAFVHAGPFANIAHGNSSIIADKIALKLADYVVTESGFGADIGMEKFCNIKCRYSQLKPDCVVVVCTVRALKMHGGGPKVTPGRPLNRAYTEENLELLEQGICNLEHHLSVVKKYGIPSVVVINRFPTDTDAEIELVKKKALEAGAARVVPGDYWEKGGEGGAQMAEAVVEACEQKHDFRFLYPLEATIKEKIETIAREVYGADGVIFEQKAEKQIRKYEKSGFGKLPICMAKTHLSISHNPKLKGRPTGFTVPVREVRLSAGAGFIYPLLGTMSTMPGLPSKPAFLNIDIDLETGKVQGLS
ncbi:MAG: formate--tetrahydrofolate ligase [Acidobacteriota bacterium]|nr:formate--tetrahydrofolate ligase [Acidobacteriota bacterium]